MTPVLAFLVAWFAVSLLLGILVGTCIKAMNPEPDDVEPPVLSGPGRPR